MNFKHSIFLAMGLACLFGQPAAAQEQDRAEFSFGGDRYVAGDTALISGTLGNDAFAAGNNVTINSDVPGDAHAAGNNVTLAGQVGGDIYAAGNNVTVSGRVGEDVTAAGNTILVDGPGVDGNVRLSGSSVNLNAPVSGSALLAGASVNVNQTVDGDLNVTAGSISFGPDAVVGGNLLIRTENVDAVAVPESVASADRVTIEQAETPDWAKDMGNVARESAWSYWPGFLPGAAIVVVLFILGAIWLALAGRRSEISYAVSERKPFKSLGNGVLTLSMVFGLVAVVAMTILGIPLVPIVLLLIFVAWVWGYIAGAYFLARRVVEAFGQKFPGYGMKLLALGIGLVAVWALGLIPFAGWLTQLLVVFFGLGAMALATWYRWFSSPAHSEMIEIAEGHKPA